MADHVCDVVVVGGGPAGMKAAVAATGAGAGVVLVEREERLGGVLKQCIHDGFGVLEFGERLTGPEYACRGQAELAALPVERIAGAFVHALRKEDGLWRLEVISPEVGVRSIDARSIVMATGCRERTDRQVFLHGDRPAGIFTAGQAQRLVNIDGVLPGRRVVILGSGDIGLIMARRLTLEGAEVVGVHEIRSTPSGLARNVAQCLEDWEIPIHLGSTVTEVHGRDRVHAVTVCPVDAHGSPLRERGEIIPCDTLVISVGLIPEDDLLVDAGLPLDPRTGGPRINQHRETESPGLYVCGNAAMVYDLVDYVSECGKSAGRAAARRALKPEVEIRGEIRVEAGPGMTQLIPQRLDPEEERPPVLFARVERQADRAIVRFEQGGVERERRSERYVRPAEMLRLELRESAWEAVRRCEDAVTVSLEVLDGS